VRESCGYLLSVLGGASGEPRFRIVPEHEPEAPIETDCAKQAVQLLYERVRACQPGALSHSASFPFAASYFFGWELEAVQLAIHGEMHESDAIEAPPPMPTNPSGSARCEPFKGRGGAPRDALASLRRGTKRCESVSPLDERNSASYLQRDAVPLGNVEKLKNLNAQARQRFKVSRSSIHGWGLFVKEPISKGEMLIEYQGNLIRASLADRFLEKYTRLGIPGDCYIFRIDESIHVDATMAGNIARFMNHSCEPNCDSKIIEVGKGPLDKHIVIYARRDLQVGEELQYDYQFALGGQKIACHCGAPNCWGRMN